MNKTNKCPRCDKTYTGYPALSRRDNKTDICSNCGTEEALYDFRLSPAGRGIVLDLEIYSREHRFLEKLGIVKIEKILFSSSGKRIGGNNQINN